ncbi:MAG: DUF4336 domain-containing protein [Roseibium sp.]|uniref:DUF4336 domain-containing protein n=1 Tax=Roseibium sp. TaxID=1936156 RepID=UPI001B199E21|nr:DUF4336 domain-containing protein [Roseibium sp.]MBO6890501.1 DUF4336 domain-containing protein [Roseibium sp.]MBO6932986.1 DUF4336 domain-containing protein [Roseibium sp.]
MTPANVTLVDDNIWIVEGGIVPFFSCPYPTRSVVVRLPSGELWIWSPIELSDELKQWITQLGRPAHLVSPNKIHHLFLQDWKEAWPVARLWGPQSTIDKRTDLGFEAALDTEAPTVWEDQFDLVRFHGSPAMDEVVFLHRPTSTAILADLSEHFSEDFLARHWKPWQRVIARLWGIVEGKGYAPLEWRLPFFNRATARKCKGRILAWKPDRVVMAHGEWVRENGTAFLKKSLSWV